MSDLTFMEKKKLERLFDMGGGYVLNFSNSALEDFVADSVGANLYDEKYASFGTSKAKRLRAFWEAEPSHVVGRLTSALVEYAVAEMPTVDGALVEECRKIAARLLEGAPVLDAEALSKEVAGTDLHRLASIVRKSIDDNQPEAALDRLHTFATKYVRGLCAARGIDVGRDKPLHSLFGEYVKALKEAGQLETKMTERILKSSISTLDAFSEVRNEHSYAHDNPVLNYDESLLVVNHTLAALRFLQALERKHNAVPAPGKDALGDDHPF